MRNRKRYAAIFIVSAMMAGVLAGCGSSSAGGSSSASGAVSSEVSSEAGSSQVSAGSEAATASVSGTAAPKDAGGEDGVFTIAYAPNESTADSADARNGLADDLSKELGCDVEEIQATDYNAIIEALRTGKADMAYMGPQAIALGVSRTNLEPIVMKAVDGDKSKAVYHSDLVVRADNNEINSIEDIKGKTIAFVDPDSTSGNLVPTAEIMKAFPNDNLNSDKLHANGEFFEAVSYSGSHQAGLQAVVKGDVDVVPVSDQIMASEIANGNVKESDLKVIHESGDIPAEAMVVGEQVNDETKQFLTNFLTNYDNQEYFEKVIKVPEARFVACTIDDYQDIIDLNNVINNAG